MQSAEEYLAEIGRIFSQGGTTTTASRFAQALAAQTARDAAIRAEERASREGHDEPAKRKPEPPRRPAEPDGDA